MPGQVALGGDVRADGARPVQRLAPLGLTVTSAGLPSRSRPSFTAWSTFEFVQGARGRGHGAVGRVLAGG